MFDTICHLFNLGKLLQKPCKIGKHPLWRIDTEQGTYAIKQLGSDKSAKHFVQQGQQVATHFAKQGFKVITALVHENNFLLCRWQPGVVLSAEAAPVNYCYQIGELLARLHTTNLNIPHITISHWQQFSAADADLLNELSHCRANIPRDLIAKLESWIANYFAAQARLTNKAVISHGDLTQANVIWENEQTPWLIDWEAAGWIHPQIELIGVLANWAGINVGELKQESFMAILQGYRAAGGEVVIDETVLWASLGSWFAWMLFNLRQYVFEQQLSEIEIVNTLESLQRLVHTFPKILTWINS